jgi:hypothetical protein
VGESTRRYPQLRLVALMVLGQHLLTSLLDPVTYPAAELIALYHERWERELAFDELKTHTLDRAEALRSKAPARVAQGVWGLLLAYNLVRFVMSRAAPRAGVPPLRLSYRHALLAPARLLAHRLAHPTRRAAPPHRRAPRRPRPVRPPRTARSPTCGRWTCCCFRVGSASTHTLASAELSGEEEWLTAWSHRIDAGKSHARALRERQAAARLIVDEDDRDGLLACGEAETGAVGLRRLDENEQVATPWRSPGHPPSGMVAMRRGGA